MELETGQWQQRSIWQLSWTSSDDSWIPRYSERPMELETGQWQQRSIWQLSWTSSDDSWIPRY